jgi:serpin B
MDGSVVLPKFKLMYEAELEDALTALGMGVAFDSSRAEFDAMSPVELYIDSVKHKTYVEVNEEGTEAAAVTSVGMALTAVRPTVNMIVDRPFFCAIVDNRTGAVLFMGAIVEPL